MIKTTDDESEETLSLCDLPLYSDQSNQDFSSSLNSNSTSSSHEDYFEFFSQELHPLPPENIIFCGKIIPYKQLSPCKPASPNQAHTRKKRWRLKFIPTKHSKRQSAQTKNGNKLAKGHGFVHSRKAKWYFFLFGISRFSPVVEMADIRSRQSRRSFRSPPSSPQPPPLFGSRNGDEQVIDRRWGLWGLIRALSCGGSRLPTSVLESNHLDRLLPVPTNTKSHLLSSVTNRSAAGSRCLLNLSPDLPYSLSIPLPRQHQQSDPHRLHLNIHYRWCRFSQTCCRSEEIDRNSPELSSDIAWRPSTELQTRQTLPF